MSGRDTLAAILCLSLGAGGTVRAQTPAKEPASKGTAMTQHATGTFEVKVQPLPADEKVPGLTVGRYRFDKEWKGDFDGTSKGEMMGTDTGVEGSAGYVAVEQMTGALKGRSGSFTLIHQSTMQKNANFDMNIKVVPDSGKGELAGITGTLKIIIGGGKHSYEFDYTLP
jgi:hypothetical protein